MTISIYNLEDVQKQPLHEGGRKELSDPEALYPSKDSPLYNDCDDDTCEDEVDSQSTASSGYDDELGLGDANANEGLGESPLRVSWAPAVVTDVRFRPRTSAEDKKALFYTNADQQRFRQEYKMQIRAVQKMRRQQYEKSRQKQQMQRSPSPERTLRESDETSVENQQHLLNNPLSGFINMISTYMSPSQQEQQQTQTQQQSSENNSSRMRQSLETAVLVDTLYLF